MKIDEKLIETIERHKDTLKHQAYRVIMRQIMQIDNAQLPAEMKNIIEKALWNDLIGNSDVKKKDT
jgi:magnesium-transporting ATPase (P-type)